MMRVMTTALPTKMISRRRRFRFRVRCGDLMTMAVFVAVVACHSIERKRENPDAKSGAHFKSAG